jgi:glycogen(starch) synthase
MLRSRVGFPADRLEPFLPCGELRDGSENDRAYSETAPLLGEMAAEFRADLLHANQFCFGAMRLPIPIVITAHSDVLSWARACGKNLENTLWLRTWRELVSAGLANATALVAPTRWMAESIHLDFPQSKLPLVIPNGRSLSETNIPDSIGGLHPRKLQAVTAGRLWDAGKNIAMLSQFDPPLPLLIAGGSRMEGEALPPRPANLKFLGPLAPDDLHALFRESAIYICTSIYEPFGLAPLEAAQCGCAILANNIASLREVWQDTALYFHDLPSLASQLQRLCNAPEQLQEAQVGAWEHAQHFDGKRMSCAYLELFLHVTGKAHQEVAMCAASA